MAELPDGMLYKYITNKEMDIDIIPEELIMCKHCDYFLPECNICTAWGSGTEPEGWCFNAEKKEEGSE